MKQTIRLNESQFNNFVKKVVKESVKRVLNEQYGVDFDDTLAWVKRKKPNMSPQEQERFAQNIINKRKGLDNTNVSDSEDYPSHKSTYYLYQKFEDEWGCVYTGSFEECVAEYERIKKKFPNTVLEIGGDAPLGRSI